MHVAVVVAKRAADAIDQRAFARAVRRDQAEPLAFRDFYIDFIACDEAAAALAALLYLEEGSGHDFALRPNQFCQTPIMPFGARTTKPTSRQPTIRRLRAEEMVTVATCCSVPSSTAPISGPAQNCVPPIIGMAIELTA